MTDATTDLLIVGTGSLCRALAHTLATAAPARPMRVRIAGRSESAVAETVAVANARAAAIGSDARFDGATIDWSRADAPDELIGDCAPRLALQLATLQSPWPLKTDDSGWARLVRAGGFGVTLPLQAALAARIARATRHTACGFLNGCFPDAVNPLLRAAGLPILAGIGNVAILAAIARAHLEPSEPLRMICHHAHLPYARRPPLPDAPAPRAWLGAAELPTERVRAALAPIRAIVGAELNQVTGVTAAELVLALLDDAPRLTHAPGPDGLPGGYPVRAGAGRIELDLPAGVSRADAIAENERVAPHDGVTLDEGGAVRFAGAALEALRAASPEIAAGFAAADLDAASDAMHALRAKLDG